MILGSVHGILGASSGRCQNPSDCRRYTRQFFGIAHVEHRKTIILFSRKRAHPFDFLPLICGLCGCVLLFSSLFRGKYTMNRLRQFQKSRQIFQGVLFTGVRKLSLQIYRIVFDCLNRVPLALQRWLSWAITRRSVLRKPPTLKLPLQASIRSAPIWKDAERAPMSAYIKQSNLAMGTILDYMPNTAGVHNHASPSPMDCMAYGIQSVQPPLPDSCMALGSQTAYVYQMSCMADV